MKARVARYFGWTDEEINKLKYSVFLDYVRSIAPLEATEMKTGIRVSSYPHSDDNGRKKMSNNLDQILARAIDDGSEPISMAELAAQMAGKLYG